MEKITKKTITFAKTTTRIVERRLYRDRIAVSQLSIKKLFWNLKTWNIEFNTTRSTSVLYKYQISTTKEEDTRLFGVWRKQDSA